MLGKLAFAEANGGSQGEKQSKKCSRRLDAKLMFHQLQDVMLSAILGLLDHVMRLIVLKLLSWTRCMLW